MTTPPIETEEVTLWRGTSSQWTNFGSYLGALFLVAGIVGGYVYLPAADRNPLFLIALAVPALIVLVRWIGTHFRVYEITSERIKITTGILSRRSTELELYRIRDYAVIEPFWLRLVGCGHIVLVTSDRTTPEILLHAIPHAAKLKDQIRKHTERLRVLRGVRDIEIDSSPPPPAS